MPSAVESRAGARADARAERPGRVFVIDDEEVIRVSCRKVLQRAGYEVETFSRGQEGIERVEQDPPPVLIVDLKMPELNGFQVIERVREVAPDVVLVVITGYATVATAIDAMKSGAYDFLPKPFTPDELRMIIDRGFERWRLQRESRRLREEKEAAQRRFVTFVSHQLKSPLVAVKEYLDVLALTRRDALPEDVRPWIDRSQVRLDEMLDLIHDWLTLARIEGGAITEAEAACDLAAVLADVKGEIEEFARARDVAVSGACTPGLAPVRGDAIAVRVLLFNLTHNAVKYNRSGGSVDVRIDGDGEEARIEVADTGFGIPDEQRERIFDEFVRVRDERTRDVPGSGLGLTLCRAIARELGGRIEVESVVGEGSRFTVHLPFAEAA